MCTPLNIYFCCKLEDGTPQLSGPEKEVESETNKFILTWVDVEKAIKLKNLYLNLTQEILSK